MTPVTALPVEGRRAYTVHHHTPTGGLDTATGWGTSISSALLDSGLPSGDIHLASKPCFACERELTGEARVSAC